MNKSKNRKPDVKLLIFSVAAFLAGCDAFFAPQFIELAIAEVVGGAAILLGFYFLLFFTKRKRKSRKIAYIYGVLSIVLGLWLLFHPSEGGPIITVLMSVFFAFTGIVKMLFALGKSGLLERLVAFVTGAACVIVAVIMLKLLEDLTLEHLGFAAGTGLIMISIYSASLALKSDY